MTDCIWQARGLAHDVEAKSAALAGTLGIPRLVARVLCVRGLEEARSAKAFLGPALEDLADPFLLPDMERAVIRILKAVRAGEKIRIYGDYDVDGVTSVCVLLRALQGLGADVDYYIPARLEEGYGVNLEAIEKAAAAGASLLITVDCGITAFREVALAAERGLDVIVTDHHEPADDLPPACAVVSPKRRDSRYPFVDLAGVGVAYKLSHALLKAWAGTLDAVEPPREMLDLVALGTIADVAPLMGENRVFAKHGLARMNSTNNIGLCALVEKAGLVGREITAGVVSFALAPRLNAAGRLGDASLSVDLLTTPSAERASRIACVLDQANQERQALEQSILEEAASMVETEGDEARDAVLVLAGEGWHAGVIGIVASRLAERFWRPAILISLEGESGRGSGRSIEPFDLYEGLSLCADLLDGFGGHRHAAGLSIARSAVASFRERINAVARRVLTREDLVRKVVCDLEIGFCEVDLRVAEELAALAPFGVANPPPTFMTRGARLVEYRGVGADARHLKLKLFRDGVVLDAIGFGLGGLAPVLFARGATCVDLVYAVDVDHWNGQRQVQLNVKGLREAASA